MLCETCHRTEATIHVSAITHGGANPDEYHFCLECAPIEAVPQFSNTEAEPKIIPKSSEALISLTPAVRGRVQSVDDKLLELEPVLRAFCARRGCALHMIAGVDPARRVWLG